MFLECGGTYEGEGCSTGAVTEVQGCSLITQALLLILSSKIYLHFSNIRTSDSILCLSLQ